MGTSTITAEGGTIRLSTASDGSVSASSGDFAVTVVQQTSTVTDFASIDALVTASEGSLTAGYYRVADTWAVAAETVANTATSGPYLTHWDGVAFNPPLPADYQVSKFLDLYWPSSQLNALTVGARVASWVDVNEGISVANATDANRPFVRLMNGRKCAQGDGVTHEWLESRHARITELGNTATNPKLAMFAIANNFGDAFRYFQTMCNDAGNVHFSGFSNGTDMLHAYRMTGATGVTGLAEGGVTELAPAIYLYVSDGDASTAWSRRSRSVDEQKAPLLTYGAEKSRTIDLYAICSFPPAPAALSRSKILAHGIAGGAKAQALYDNPAAFFAALGRVYGL